MGVLRQGVLVAGISGVPAFPLHAAPAAVHPGSAAVEAKQHYARSRQRYAQGDLPGATAEMLKAYELDPTAVRLFHVAKLLEEAGKADAAIRFYERYLRDYPGAAKQAEVEATLQRLRSPRPPPPPPGADAADGEPGDGAVELSLETGPAGAAVSLDGEETAAGQTPLALRLTPGKHVLRVSWDGSAPLGPEAAAGPDGTPVFNSGQLVEKNAGLLLVDCDTQDTRVFLDGKLLAVTPVRERHAVTAGHHVLALERPGYKRLQQAVDITRGTETRVWARMESTAFPSPLPLVLAPALGLPLLPLAAVGTALSVPFAFEASISVARSQAWARATAALGCGLGLAAALVLVSVAAPVVAAGAWAAWAFFPRPRGAVQVLPGVPLPPPPPPPPPAAEPAAVPSAGVEATLP